VICVCSRSESLSTSWSARNWADEGVSETTN